MVNKKTNLLLVLFFVFMVASGVVTKSMGTVKAEPTQASQATEPTKAAEVSQVTQTQASQAQLPEPAQSTEPAQSPEPAQPAQPAETMQPAQPPESTPIIQAPQTTQGAQEDSQIKLLQEEIAKLKTDAANNKRILAAENSSLLNQLNLLKKTKEELEAQVKSLKASNEKLVEKPTQLEQKLSACSKAKEEFSIKAQELEKKQAELLKERDLLAKENSTFKKETAQLTETISALQKDKASLSEVYKKAQGELKQALNKVSADKKSIKDLTANSITLKEKLFASQGECSVLKNDNKRLRRLLVPVQGLKSKLAVSYQLLGTAYIQLKKYDLAIDAYKKSLKYNFKNALVHYNLGLLYEHSRLASKKAIRHLKIYLKLSPDAPDAREIEYIIKRLSEVNDTDEVFFDYY